MNSLALWLLVSAAMVALSSASKGIPSYVTGEYNSHTKYIFKKSLTNHFDKGALVIHFNTCHDYRFDIDKIVVTTTNGKSVHGKMVAGGLNTFFFGLRLTSQGQVFYDVEVWATWQQQEAAVDSGTMLTFKTYHPCANPKN
uniref:Reelin domain-containing protein n=1 Tax=Graphocephala atropunctata TaxID=36148 RepID=A0A1B6KN27_9HEMI